HPPGRRSRVVRSVLIARSGFKHATRSESSRDDRPASFFGFIGTSPISGNCDFRVARPGPVANEEGRRQRMGSLPLRAIHDVALLQVEGGWANSRSSLEG